MADDSGVQVLPSTTHGRRKPHQASYIAERGRLTAYGVRRFNYLAAMLADITGMPTVWIPAILALFGIGAFAGLSIGGRISDRRPGTRDSRRRRCPMAGLVAHAGRSPRDRPDLSEAVPRARGG